jgi:predicted nucleic acid-binding protein
MRVYMDSSIVIRLLEGTDEMRSIIRARCLGLPGLVLCSSPLVRLECLPKVIKAKEDAARVDYETFFGRVENLILDMSAFDRAVELASTVSLKSMDALHLATAEVNECNEFWTADSDYPAPATSALPSATAPAANS